MSHYSPPFTLTPAILSLVEQIGETLGRWSLTAEREISPRLRRGNRIRTIQASLAIENNTLTVEQSLPCWKASASWDCRAKSRKFAMRSPPTNASANGNPLHAPTSRRRTVS